jgi:hypothetical protein
MSEHWNPTTPPGQQPPAPFPSAQPPVPTTPTPWAGGQGPVPGHLPPPQSPPPPAPGRGRWLVAGAVVLVAAVAGGGALVLTPDDDDSGDGASVVAPSALDLEDLRPALLTEDDLGGEWRSQGASNNTGLPDGWEMSDECRRLLRQLGMDPSEQVPAVQDNFVEGSSDTGATLIHNLTLVDAETPSLGELGDAMETCGELTYDDGEWITMVETRPVEGDGPGDEVLAFEIDLAVAQVGIQTDVVGYHGYGLMSRRDGVESTVSSFAGFPEGAQDAADDGGVLETDAADVDLVHDLAEVAEQKVSDVLAG